MRFVSVIATVLFYVLGFSQSVEQLMQRYGLKWEEALATRLIADETGAPILALIEARRSTGLDIFRLAPSAFIQPQNPQHPAGLHAKGQGWGVIAHRLGVHPGTFNKTRKGLKDIPDRDLEDDVWIRILIRRYGITEKELKRVRMSRNWHDIVPAVHISKTKRIKIDSLVVRRMESWDGYRKKTRVPIEPPVLLEKEKGKPSTPGLSRDLGNKDKSKGKDKGRKDRDDDKGGNSRGILGKVCVDVIENPRKPE